MESKYLKAFEAAREAGVLPNFRGAILLVECLPKQELTRASGIIMGVTDKTHRGTAEDTRRALGIVLAVGEGYGDGTPCARKPGDLVVLPYSPWYLSEFPGINHYISDMFAVVNESDTLIDYDSFDHLELFKSVMRANGF